MGKVETGIYCYLTADILTEVLQKCSLSSPLPNRYILSKPLNFIGCHGNRHANFAKEYLKNHLLRSHKGYEAETLQTSQSESDCESRGRWFEPRSGHILSWRFMEK